MGTHQHTAVLFTAQDDYRPICELYEQVVAREKALEIELPSLLTPLMSGFNAYRTFAIMPHGSSLGRPRAMEVDQLIRWARQLAKAMHIDSTLVSWGELGTRVDDGEDQDAVIDTIAVPSQKALT